jgi:hypothetical protein
MFYKEGSSLDLDLIVQSYEADRKQYWGEDEEGERYIQGIDRIAKMLLQGSSELIEPEALSWDLIQQMADEDLLRKQIRERIEIDVAWEYSVNTRGMAHRCLELARLVVVAKPNESVMRFLRRLSRCYVAGFLPECVVLCRAVVENALIERLDRRGDSLPYNAQGPSTLAARIDEARMRQFLSEETAKAAHAVRRRGNTAVHKDPHATHAVLETIKLTMDVLRDLYGA